jgi:hypothetical protein
MRGKVLFVVINTFTKQYLSQFPGLRGAVMFTSDIAPHDNSTVFLEPANEQYTSDQVRAASIVPQELRIYNLRPPASAGWSTTTTIKLNPVIVCSQVTAAAGRVTGFADRGYIVRVRSDYDTLEARANDTSRVCHQKGNVTLASYMCCLHRMPSIVGAALQMQPRYHEARGPDASVLESQVKALAAAGAHIISTDFPSLPTYFNSSYQVISRVSTNSSQAPVCSACYSISFGCR